MRLHLTAKEPGPGGIRLRPVSLDLSYATAFDQRTPDAYERLLMDVVRGNPTLFMRRDDGVDRGAAHWSVSCQARPSRSMSAAAAKGPGVPAG